MRSARHPAKHALRLVAVTVLIGGILTSCTTPRPGVTFYGNRDSVRADPALWCETDMTQLVVTCADGSAAPDAVVSMALRKGDSVQINVDGQLADEPWQAVFAYTDTKGELQSSRTQVFTDRQLSYRLPLPDPGDQFVRIEVQAGLVPLADGIGVTRSWVLTNPLAGCAAGSTAKGCQAG